MKKLIYTIVIAAICIGCSHKQQIKPQETIYDKGDSVYVGGIGNLDSAAFLKAKDTLIYNKEDEIWVTRRTHWFWYECPDTITVAFTRNGKFEDSVIAVRQGLVANDKGEYYSPAYVIRAVVGDTWTYDINGKFIEFNCVDYPHSGTPHKYKP